MFKDVFGPFTAQETFSLSPIVSRPKSRGSVTLAAGNIQSPPVVDLNYFGDERDMDLMIKGKMLEIGLINQVPMFNRMPFQKTLYE